MLERCLSGTLKAYEAVTISSEFLDFQTFMEWAEKQAGFGLGWEIDKDLLSGSEKIYSSSTCVFLPKKINAALVLRTAQRSSGGIGVRWRADRSYYYAQMNFEGKSKYLGRSKSKAIAFKMYKEAKERYLKELAEEYKSLLDPRAYNALLSYEVVETD